jgi:hypothetical protein
MFGVCNVAPARDRSKAHKYLVVRKKHNPAVVKKDVGSDDSQRQTPLPPPAGASFASVEHFAADPTLRSGDVVVTPHGFLVYHEQGRHFTALEGRKTALAALERASRAPTAAKWETPSTLAEWRPAASLSEPEISGGIRTISFGGASSH